MEMQMERESASSKRKRSERSEDVEDVEEEEGAAVPTAALETQSQSTERNRNKKVKVMGASGQTDAERRELRSRYRSINKEITSSTLGDNIEDPNSDALDIVRGMNNDAWDNVRYAREAVLDGENLHLISVRAGKQIDKLLQVPRYDPQKLTRKLKQKCTTGPDKDTFDWELLGKACATCFQSVPTGMISFLNGPLEAGYKPKERKKPERRRRVQEASDEEEEQVEKEDADKDKAQADKLSAVEKQMTTSKKVLRKRCQKLAKERFAALNVEGMDEATKNKKIQEIQQTSDICAINYMFNPNSFTQTVENIFNFSFQVKKGDAMISVKKEQNEATGEEVVRPVVMAMKPPLNVTPRQAIVTLNMQDWRDLCQKFDVQKGYIPHRTGSRITVPAQTQQQQQGDDDE